MSERRVSEIPEPAHYSPADTRFERQDGAEGGQGRAGQVDIDRSPSSR